VNYALCGVRMGAGGGGAGGTGVRFFFLTYVGGGVGGMKRARVAMQKSGVYNCFEGVVASVDAMDKDAASHAAVTSALRKALANDGLELV
jgi:hypothetical protein